MFIARASGGIWCSTVVTGSSVVDHQGVVTAAICDPLILKAQDRLPALRVTLLDSATGLPIDLTTAVSATIRFFRTGQTTSLFDAPVTIVSPFTSGILEYAWNIGDTDTPGNYYAEWNVVYAGNYPKTYPSTTYSIVIIEPRLPAP